MASEKTLATIERKKLELEAAHIFLAKFQDMPEQRAKVENTIALLESDIATLEDLAALQATMEKAVNRTFKRLHRPAPFEN